MAGPCLTAVNKAKHTIECIKLYDDPEPADRGPSKELPPVASTSLVQTPLVTVSVDLGDYLNFSGLESAGMIADLGNKAALVRQAYAMSRSI